MGLNGHGPNGYGLKWLWAEFGPKPYFFIRPVCKKIFFLPSNMSNSQKFSTKNQYQHKVLHIIIFFLIQFNVPFKIISLIETSQWVGGEKPGYPRKTT